MPNEVHSHRRSRLPIVVEECFLFNRTAGETGRTPLDAMFSAVRCLYRSTCADIRHLDNQRMNGFDNIGEYVRSIGGINLRQVHLIHFHDLFYAEAFGTLRSSGA